ncbi:hypothetical protein [Psychroflexus aestuariivivens]|uniref:hypothetical protein n=1 Tax=Psychroflexus aestuariivivens TaxID=1795040 RepID=UPI000FDC15B6|nr:hypothetical protein [Psychroflexus aestuariivivens]
MKVHIKYFVFSFCLLGLMFSTYAQFPANMPGTPEQDTIDNPAAPIDQFIIYMIIVGSLFAYRKLNSKVKD